MSDRLGPGGEIGSDPFARRGLMHASKPRCAVEWPSRQQEPGDEPHVHRCRRSVHRSGTMHVCLCGATLQPKTKATKLGRSA